MAGLSNKGEGLVVDEGGEESKAVIVEENERKEGD